MAHAWTREHTNSGLYVNGVGAMEGLPEAKPSPMLEA